MMKIFNYKFLTILASVFVLVFAFTQTSILGNFTRNNSTARAVGDLNVDWGVPEGNPIFVVNNMMPGQAEERTVKVKNGASSPRPIGVRGIKTSETGNLAQALNIIISENGTSLYGPKKLSEFFQESEDPEGIFLSTINPLNTTNYQFKVLFDESAGNEYQGKSVVFDIEIGISITVPEECQSIKFDKIIYGTQGNDNLKGTNGNDLIFGFEGNDVVNSSNGDDCLVGGSGNDILHGSNGQDVIFGDEGDDRIDGSNGDDLLFGGSGNDTIYASNGNDRVEGGDGNDKIDGNNGDDTIYGGAGNDVIDGGNGNDSVDGGSGDDKLTGRNGNDTLIGGDGNDWSDGGLGTDICEAETKKSCEK